VRSQLTALALQNLHAYYYPYSAPAVATLSPACSYAKIEKVGAFAFFILPFLQRPLLHDVLTECTGEGAFFCALPRTVISRASAADGSLGVAV
jgi:hypothetical protein